MAEEIRRKSSFGTVKIDRFSPQLPEGTPKGINVVLSFEEALKLHMGLLQILGKLNSYDRSTPAGKRSAVNLCIFTDVRSLTINEDKVADPNSAKSGRKQQ